jgi:hypothetical protein
MINELGMKYLPLLIVQVYKYTQHNINETAQKKRITHLCCNFQWQ